MKQKIGFCFLVRGEIPHATVWQDCLKDCPTEAHGVYCHPKDLKAFSRRKGVKVFKNTAIKKRVSTGWGGISLVEASLNLFEAALKDNCTYVILLSEACYPLYGFSEILKRLGRNNFRSILKVASLSSRPLRNTPEEIKEQMELREGRLAASQWCGFNKTHVEFLLKSDVIKRYSSHKKFSLPEDYTAIRSREFAGAGPPDEWYFPTLLAEKGKISECIIDTPLTYVEWPASGVHPKCWWKFEGGASVTGDGAVAHRMFLNFLKRARRSKALFARKINHVPKKKI